MPKAIEFDPVAHLKTLPAAFWLKVPTYDDRYRCDMLQPYEYVDTGEDRHGRSRGQRSQDKRPDACALFPQYAEFFDKFLNLHKAFPLYRPHGIKCNWDKPIEKNAANDWVECVIGDFRFRYEDRERKFTHPEIDGWLDCRDAYNLGYNDDFTKNPEGVGLYKQYERAEKKVANTWNRLRKKARRAAGVELGTKDAVKAKAIAKEKLVKEETEKCVTHIDEFIAALKEHKENVIAGTITREDTGYIFGMTNEMTARNAALRDALGNK